MEGNQSTIWDVETSDSPTPIATASLPMIEQESLNILYDSYYKTKEIISNARQAHRELEKRLLNDTCDAEKHVKDYVEDVIDVVFKNAQKQYAPAQISLKIDQKVEMKNLNLDRWQEDYSRGRNRSNQTSEQQAALLRPINFDVIFNHLKDTFGGDYGVRLAHKQQAQLISKFFRMEDQEIKESSHGIVLTKEYFVTIDKYTGKNRYSFDYVQIREWQAIAIALAGFAEFMGLPHLVEELQALTMSVSEVHNYLTMPTIWTQPHFRFKAYANRKIEFAIKRDVALKLQLYLGEFLN